MCRTHLWKNSTALVSIGHSLLLSCSLGLFCLGFLVSSFLSWSYFLCWSCLFLYWCSLLCWGLLNFFLWLLSNLSWCILYWCRLSNWCFLGLYNSATRFTACKHF